MSLSGAALTRKPCWDAVGEFSQRPAVVMECVVRDGREVSGPGEPAEPAEPAGGEGRDVKPCLFNLYRETLECYC
jgi:hypothetical protein